MRHKTGYLRPPDNRSRRTDAIVEWLVRRGNISVATGIEMVRTSEWLQHQGQLVQAILTPEQHARMEQAILGRPMNARMKAAFKAQFPGYELSFDGPQATILEPLRFPDLPSYLARQPAQDMNPGPRI